MIDEAKKLEDLSEIRKRDKIAIICKDGVTIYGEVSNFDGKWLNLRSTDELKCPFVEEESDYRIKLKKSMDVYRLD